MKLSVDHLNKSYKNCRAISDLSFCIESGEIVGLLGHNGAGKSTLIKCMMNAIKSYTGSISIDGRDLRQNQKLLSDECSFLLEPSFCEYMTARQNLRLLSGIISRRSRYSIDDVLALVSLKNAADRKVGEFSFGMRQRLGLAQVFLSTPHFVILDEPTVGLDPLGIEIIKNRILELSRNGVSVLFSSHQINDVFDICTRVIVLNSGSLVFDGGIDRLLEKTYVIVVDRPVEHMDELSSLSDRIAVSENTIRIRDSGLLSKVLDALIGHGFVIKDITTENSFENLRTYLNRQEFQ
ncbi:MAG: ABC transporter ATP-binding protein [Oscillospiraceae bacterium]|jgi:ABC-type multidrug transport system ATPase subunit